jgi:hypothetical protein
LFSIYVIRASHLGICGAQTVWEDLQIGLGSAERMSLTGDVPWMHTGQWFEQKVALELDFQNCLISKR